MRNACRRLPAEAHAHRSGRHQALDAGGAVAAAAGERLRGAAPRARRARLRTPASSRMAAPRTARSAARRATYPGSDGVRHPFPIWSTPRRRGAARGSTSRRPRTRWRSFAGHAAPTCAGCASPCASRRCPSTTAARQHHGPLRRDRSRRRLVRLPLRRQGRAPAAAARALPVVHAVREVARRARAARALADHGRRLARRSSRPTARSTSATRARTSARTSGGTSSPRRSGSRRRRRRSARW